MKSLVQYIKEAFEDNEIQDLIVRYSICDGKDIVLYTPKTYSEDDIVTYFGDVVIENSPAGKKNIEKLFGANAEKLIDVHFEYDSFSKADDHGNIFCEWDNKNDTKNYDNDEMGYFRFKNVRMVLQFESFSIKVTNQSDVDFTLHKIFDATESSSLHHWECEIKLAKHKPFEYKASF